MTAESIRVKEILVVKGEPRPGSLSEEDAWHERWDAVAEETGCLVIALPEGGSIETLDEDEMRANGWVRA